MAQGNKFKLVKFAQTVDSHEHMLVSSLKVPVSMIIILIFTLYDVARSADCLLHDVHELQSKKSMLTE